LKVLVSTGSPLLFIVDEITELSGAGLEVFIVFAGIGGTSVTFPFSFLAADEFVEKICLLLPEKLPVFGRAFTFDEFTIELSETFFFEPVSTLEDEQPFRNIKKIAKLRNFFIKNSLTSCSDSL
jgi:hypothetical protein